MLLRSFIAAALLGSAAVLTASPAGALTPSAPAIHHVWVIVLENKDYDETWGPVSKAPYLASTLRSQGKLLTQYYGTGHLSLDNYVSMISGQPPNPQTQADCQRFTDFVGTVGPDGIAVGQGCVYPAGVQTIADQLDAKGLPWKAYLQDMGADPARDNGTTCAHPPIGLTSTDPTQTAAPNDQYATRHNPFVYFHSIIDEPSCNDRVVPLDHLGGDLATSASTPAFSFVTPDLCNDAHDEPCADGQPGGLTQANAFLSTVVPAILGSPAYADGGMVVITFDEAEAANSGFDASACCNEPVGPNSALAGLAGPGGGRIGALVLSPFVTAGTVSDVPYNHYSLLRSLEDAFGLDHLANAAADGLVPFGQDVYDASTPTNAPAAAAPGPAAPPIAFAATASPPPSTRALPVTGGDTALWTAGAFGALALALAARRLGRTR